MYKPDPVEVSRLVLVHVRGERRTRQLLEATLQEVGAIRVADDVHRVRSATAWAASPSPRPVKPRRSVVVARTAHRVASTPSAPASRSPISLAHIPDPWLLPDEDAVGVHELPAGLAHLAVGLGKEVERRRSTVPLVSGGEERADVAEVRGAEDRVDERMRDDVAVRVAGEPARMVDRHAAEHERHALLERVRVEADPDPELAHIERG